MDSNRNINHPTLKLSGRKTESRGLAAVCVCVGAFPSLFLHPGPTLLAAPSPVAPPQGRAGILPVPVRDPRSAPGGRFTPGPRGAPARRRPRCCGATCWRAAGARRRRCPPGVSPARGRRGVFEEKKPPGNRQRC